MKLVSCLLAVGALTGCTVAQHPQNINRGQNQWVLIPAGILYEGHGTYATYGIDRATETCWMMAGNVNGLAVAPLDCCAARKVEEARNVISWENDATCATSAAPTIAPPGA